MKAARVLQKAAAGVAGGGASASSKSRYPPLPAGWTAIIGIETHAQLCPDPLGHGGDVGPSGSKLFSDARLVPSGTFGPASSSAESVPPNSLVTPFDAAYPGTLPRRLQQRSFQERNTGKVKAEKGGHAEEASFGPVHQAVRTALALRCTDINPASTFDRKHYFYADLTSGYQITQKYAPLAKNGSISLQFEDGYLPTKDDELDVEIECIQLEQDTAKSTHVQGSPGVEGGVAESQTLIDLNRSGSGLMEIVSGPSMRTPDQAGAYIRKLQEILRAVGASDGNMDEGSLRCDVNVSVFRPHLKEPWGVRTEVKNLNSAKFVMQAIAHETHRQVQRIEEAEASGELDQSPTTSVEGTIGHRVVRVLEQETRGFDEKTGTTFRLRSKEEAPEYRFMPDPNLPPLTLSKDFLDSVQRTLPELPEATRERLMQKYALSVREANVLLRASPSFQPAGLGRSEQRTSPSTAVAYFETLASLVNPRVAINWTINELMKSLNSHGIGFESCPLAPNQLAELLTLVEQRRVTGTVAKTLLPELIERPELLKESLSSLLEYRGVLAESQASSTTDSDTSTSSGGGSDTKLTMLCSTMIEDFPTEAKLIRAGKHKIIMKLVGEVMKRTRGTADAVKARETFTDLLQPDPDP
ncbi:unnamed protein product [Tilletia caries]|uniref:Glutamyl-tRNA(Gln) amidotransferase subunit B, mitochondrial n=1 Tax=Tilletia caries TaxID=13290 RepID=A0ABN7IP33_9BASI|nr:unnamed protein product [Tilletia caries]